MDDVAANKLNTNEQTRRFCITIFLQLLREKDLLPGKKPGSRPALIPLFAKKFFHAVRTRGDTNEVDRTNILAPGF
jgi:hypothetical protein